MSNTAHTASNNHAAAPPIDVLCFGGTSASFLHGTAYDKALIRKIEAWTPGPIVTTASTATLAALRHVKAGKVTALAVTSRQRSTLAPEVPTVAEAGHKGLEREVLYIAMVPAATPDAEGHGPRAGQGER